MWVRPGATSMRLGIRGLSSIVWGWQGHSPASGDVYVFFSADRRQAKLLRWDTDGFILYQKRLCRGRFAPLAQDASQGVCRLDWDTFYFLMRGLKVVEDTRSKRFKMPPAGV